MSGVKGFFNFALKQARFNMVKLNNKFELQNLSGLKHTLTNIEITKFLQENFVGSATDVTKSFECMLQNER